MNLSQEFNPLSSTLNQPLGDAALGEGALEPPNDIFGTSVSGPRHRGLQQKTKIQNEALYIWFENQSLYQCQVTTIKYDIF